MKTNLKDYALKVLETAKENLRRDRYLLPAAFIATDNDVSDFNLQFEDAHQKRSVYAELVELAGQKATRAIITINDTTVTSDLEGRFPWHRRDTSRQGGKTGLHFSYDLRPVHSNLASFYAIYVHRRRNRLWQAHRNSERCLNLLPGWPAARKPDAQDSNPPPHLFSARFCLFPTKSLAAYFSRFSTLPTHRRRASLFQIEAEGEDWYQFETARREK